MQQESLFKINGHAQFTGGQFTMNNYQVSNFASPTNVAFERLHAQTAVTALHNALNSFKSGRCHPNTREAVLTELFQFIQEDPTTRRNWILWLSGPAGSGKTTIARTLAYLCDDKGVNQASFFFCRLDLARNGIKPLVATLAYQIACRFPSVKGRILAEIERMPHIFSLSIEEQFRGLITMPLNESGWRGDSTVMAKPHPIVCVVDALDECEGEDYLEVQFDAVQTLYTLVSGKDCPVIFILSSRPEANLRMSFNRIRQSIARVYLDNSYDPSVDIRRFVVDKFEEIRTIHPLASSLSQDWPKSTAIDAIVAKSSGQFVYAATVMQYISSPWSHPATNLDRISDSLSTELSSMPFTVLDDLFTFIFDRATKQPILLTIISCHLLSRDLSDVWFSLLLELHGHSFKSIQPYLIEITSLVELDNKKERLIIHNESMLDFLVDSRRSGGLYIDLGGAAYDSLMTVLRNRTRDDVHLVVDYIIALLPKVTKFSEEMRTILLEFSREALIIHPQPFLTGFGHSRLINACSNSQIGWQDLRSYRNIWLEWSVENQNVELEPEDVEDELEPACCYRSDVPEQVKWGSPGSPPWFQDQLQGVGDLHGVKHLLASVLISEATGMLFGDIADLLGYDSDDCARILSTLPSLLEYDSKEQIITFIHGRALLNYMSRYESRIYHIDTHGRALQYYMSRYGSGIYHIDTQAFAAQAITRILSLSNSYKGNPFGDMGALLLMIWDPTTDLTAHLSEFATHMLESQLQVHVLDFTALLDGLAHMYGKYNNSRFTRLRRPSYPYIYSHTTQDHATDPHAEYIELLTLFVRFWRSRHGQLDPQLLSIPEFSSIWEHLVLTR